jgi:RNA polymerase primary sigma factor
MESGDSQSQLMTIYIRDIERYGLLTSEEEEFLSAEVESGNEEAREKFILSNLRLVVKIAHDYKNLGVPVMDLIEEGNMGLMKAVERFKTGKGAKFSSYASWWIKQAIRKSLSLHNRNIKIPCQAGIQLFKIRKAKNEFKEKNDTDPSNKELAALTGLSLHSVNNLMLSAYKDTVSINTPIEDSTLEQIIPDESCVSIVDKIKEGERIDLLYEVIDTLLPREKRVLELRYGLTGMPSMTLREISDIVGKTRERVRQIQNDAERKIFLLKERFMD